MLPRKIDWLLSDRREDVKQIMYDNGTFINFPIIGSQASLLSVYGDHRVNIERTIRTIMLLVGLYAISDDSNHCTNDARFCPEMPILRVAILATTHDL